MDEFRSCVKLKINSCWAHEAVKQGVGHAKAGQYDEARRCYDKAIELQPDHVDAHVARGAAHANEKKLQAAVDDLRKALSIDPQNANAKRYLEAVETKALREGVKLDQRDAPVSHGAQQHTETRETPGVHTESKTEMDQPPTKGEAADGKLGSDEHHHVARSNQGAAAVADTSLDDKSSASSGSDSDSDHDEQSMSLKAALQAVLRAKDKSSSRKSKKHSKSKKRARKEGKHKDRHRSKKRRKKD